MAHTGNTSTVIDIPNEYGLCVMHHTSVYGAPPEEYEIPYPGMVVKKGKNAWMKEGHHWASLATSHSTQGMRKNTRSPTLQKTSFK